MAYLDAHGKSRFPKPAKWQYHDAMILSGRKAFWEEYPVLVVLAAVVFVPSCYRSRSSSSNGDTEKDTESYDLGTSDTHNTDEMSTSSSEDTDVGTDSKSDIEADSDSDIGTDTGTAPGLDTGSDACTAMNASHDGTECDVFLGVYWDGKLCRSIYCGCTGEDCDKLYISEQECMAAFFACMEDCPNSDWPIVLTQEDDGCLCGQEQYEHCCPDGMDFCTCNEATSRYEERLMCGETEPTDF